MKEFIRRNLYLFLVFAAIIALFFPFFVHQLLPIPSDALIGMYHPYRDFFSEQFPRGYPFKNFLITDPVRQIIPWKMLTVELFSKGQLPLWNPYEMAGKPLLASFQAGVFYPLNIILFIKPFAYSWSVFIFLQQVLASIFFYLYVTNLNIDRRAAAFGSIAFVFSGFFISWLEWGNIIHTGLWLPLILFAIDKVFQNRTEKAAILKWLGLATLALVCAFFAGHLQTFFYVSLIIIAYLLCRIYQLKEFKLLPYFLVLAVVFLLVTVVQWLPTFQYITLSARNIDQVFTQKEGWFLPWEHLIQFIAPDFFGNPVTMNYWGTWNYGELTGYIGVIPLIFALFSIFRKDKKTYFFAGLILLSLIFSLPTFFAKVPFQLNIPFLSSAQPTRLLFVAAFSLSVLTSLGFDLYVKKILRERKMDLRTFVIPLAILSGVFIFLWMIPILHIPIIQEMSDEQFQIAKRNLIFPTILFISFIAIFLFTCIVRFQKIGVFAIIFIFGITIADLYRFGNKFLPFTPQEFLFPDTKTTQYLQKNIGMDRIALLNNELLAPNIATAHKIQSIEGYDPLYLERYARYVSVLERNSAHDTSMMSFNRIITPHNIDSHLINLLNARYVLSLHSLDYPFLRKVHEEGQTLIYENDKAVPRAYFVSSYKGVISQEEQLKHLYSADLGETAVVETKTSEDNLSVGKAVVSTYNENEVIIQTENTGDGFLVLMDSYYPTWRAYVDEMETTIYITNGAFRGVKVPKGNHTIRFVNKLF